MKSWPILIAVFAIQGSCFLPNLRAVTIPVQLTAGISQGDGSLNDPTLEQTSIDCYLELSSDGYGGKWIIGQPGSKEWKWETTGGESGDGGSVNLSGVLDPDPMIGFSSGVVDFGAPSNFTFTFILPLIPQVSNPSTVFDSLTGTVTNGGAAGLTVTALAPPPGILPDGDGVTELQVFSLSDDNAATWKNVGLDAGPTQAFPGLTGSQTYGPLGGFNQGPIATIPVGGVGKWTHMRVDLNFGLTGGNDAFSFSGAKVLTPEPNGMLLALGAITAGYLSRRRR